MLDYVVIDSKADFEETPPPPLWPAVTHPTGERLNIANAIVIYAANLPVSALINENSNCL